MESAKKRRSFDLEFKLRVLKVAKAKSGEAAAKEFGINPKQVREWKKKEAIYKTLTSTKREKLKMGSRKRANGGGRKRVNENLDAFLLDWVMTQRMRSLRVSRRSIREEAKRIVPTLSDEGVGSSTFKASTGWLQKFMKRNNLYLRRRTTVAQKDPENLSSKIVSYVMYVSEKVRTKKISHNCIIAMDETSLWFDMLSNTTVAQTGSKSVALKSTGNEKAHATVVLAAKGDGTKLKPFVVFKQGIREVKKLQETPGIVVRSSCNGWMNDELTLDWLKNVYTTFSFRHRLLAWDSYKCHISESTKNALSRYNTSVAVIPGGCTKYIQAPDVSWNKPFKAHLTRLYDVWLAGDFEKDYTKGGNLKAPSRRLLLKWVTEAWESIPNDLILKSFKTCALTTAIDGSEDDQVHCLKRDQPCHPAFEMLRMARLEETFEVHDLTEDLEEEEKNEAVIDLSDIEDEVGVEVSSTDEFESENE